MGFRFFAALLFVASAAVAGNEYDTARASYQAKTGDQGQAAALAAQSLQRAERETGKHSLETAQALLDLGVLHHSHGQHARAEPLLRRSLAILESKLDPQHPHLDHCLNLLASIYSRQGLYSNAETFFRRSLAIRENTRGTAHPDTLSTMQAMANLYRDMGNTNEQQILLDRINVVQQFGG